MYTRPSDPDAVDIVDLDNPPPSKQAELPCTAAIEFLADVYEQEGKGSVTKATEVRSVGPKANKPVSLTSSIALEIPS